MLSAVCCLFPLAVLSGADAMSAGAQPLGELKVRTEMAIERMLSDAIPAFTEDFILADVALDPAYPRRFSNYSGDLSGRYIGAFAMTDPGAMLAKHPGLVPKLLTHQRGDGRFGSMDLVYSPETIALDHMALLWGNGRLLVGLMEYQSVAPSDEVLEASRRLGDFLMGVYEACANEAVAARVKNRGAAGMICFSQLVEGLVMLANATGEADYIEGAARAAECLPEERGKQHSHGYLTTLRGMVMLYEANRNPEVLARVESLFGALIASDDYHVYGGVQEYFGSKARDEGCSEADFLRLSLQLWRVTGKMDYLERAEHCLVNQFYANQFETGDFGHHVYFADGVAPFQGVGRAWWCCTMHGLRACRDVWDAAVTVDGDLVRVNLFQGVQWADAARALTLTTAADGTHVLSVAKAPVEGVRVQVRRPAWAKEVVLTVNGDIVEVRADSGYLELPNALKAGDRLTIALTYKYRLVKRDSASIEPSELTSNPVDAVLFCGPWLLGVDEGDNGPFFGEPWGGNRINLPAQPQAGDTSGGALEVPGAHVSATYTHDGFPGEYPVTLRPMSERTAHDPVTFAAWLNYRAKE
ncbi:MAG: hypothetical protein GWP08_08230 [Nitrospiraceae bacterium]|nr:hypothetical protein [Nitrospiraceae bacterium]